MVPRFCPLSSLAAGERLVRPTSVEERDQDGGRLVRRGGWVQPGHRALGGDSGVGQARPGVCVCACYMPGAALT